MLKRNLLTYLICLIVCSPFIMAYVKVYKSQQVDLLERQVSVQLEAATAPLKELHGTWANIYKDSFLYNSMKSWGMGKLYSIDEYAELVKESRQKIDSVMKATATAFSNVSPKTLLPVIMEAMAFERDSLIGYYSDRAQDLKKEFNLFINDERFFVLADRLDSLVKNIYYSGIFFNNNNSLFYASSAAQQFRLYDQRDIDEFNTRQRKQAAYQLEYSNRALKNKEYWDSLQAIIDNHK